MGQDIPSLTNGSTYDLLPGQTGKADVSIACYLAAGPGY